MPAKSIIAMLEKDHDEVSRLIKQAAATSDSAAAKRTALFEAIREALNLHMAFEEENIYPLLQEAKKTRDDALEAVEEHTQVKHLLEDIAGTSVDDEHWKAKVTVLGEDIQHHVREEEQEDGLFAKLRKLVETETLAELAETYAAMKHHVPG
jgi:iron-sulfur cluster repair protein YtfE (RIC family)